MKALLSFVFVFTYAHAEDPPTNPVAVVQTMETNFGVHPGFRRNHAKGVCALGTFTASKEARGLSRSPLFAGKAIPVIARFSMAGGVPAIPDNTKAPHGMALQFNLGDKGMHNMSMINAPIFAVKTPEAFHQFLIATAPAAKDGSPDGAKVKAFIGSHPEIMPFLNAVNGVNPPASYATTPYFSLHAFKFTNAKKHDQFLRWRFEPKGGTVLLTDAEVPKADANFLETDLKTRTAKQPVEWTMLATLAEKGDSLVDPTSGWPKERKEVALGTLRLNKAVSQVDGPCDKINYDPNLVSDGVAPSDDPVLRFRSGAYAVSFSKRISEKK